MEAPIQDDKSADNRSESPELELIRKNKGKAPSVIRPALSPPPVEDAAKYPTADNTMTPAKNPRIEGDISNDEPKKKKTKKAQTSIYPEDIIAMRQSRPVCICLQLLVD